MEASGPEGWPGPVRQVFIIEQRPHVRTFCTAFCFCFIPLIVLKECTWHLGWVISFSPNGCKSTNAINWGISNWAKRHTPQMQQASLLYWLWTPEGVCVHTVQMCPTKARDLKRNVLLYYPFNAKAFPSQSYSPAVSWLVLALSQKKIKSTNINIKLQHNFTKCQS